MKFTLFINQESVGSSSPQRRATANSNCCTPAACSACAFQDNMQAGTSFSVLARVLAKRRTNFATSKEFRTSEVLGGTAGHSSKNRYCPARFGTVDRYAYACALHFQWAWFTSHKVCVEFLCMTRIIRINKTRA